MMNNSIEKDFDCMCGQASTDDLDQFAATCQRMRQIGYKGVMANVFFSIEPFDFDLAGRKHLFTEDDSLIVLLSEERRAMIKKILDDNDLILPSCHFLQTLQPPGKKPEWIFDVHEQLLDVAASFGAEFVTTHFGWMFAEQSVDFMGDNVKLLNEYKMSRDDYLLEAIKRFGGMGKALDDSYLIYQNLCRAAAARGITVTIETVPSPFDTGSAGEIIELISTIGEKNLAICIDSGHCNAISLSTADQIRIAGPLMAETHFHDNYGPQRNWPLSDLHNPLGIGTIDWIDVIKALGEIDYQGMVTFEQKNFEMNAQAWRYLINLAKRLSDLPEN